MLVLSRKKNESIVVNDAIVITVVEIRGDKVRLGIEAPREVPIHRSEVYAAIQAFNQNATGTDSGSSSVSQPAVSLEVPSHAESSAVNGNDPASASTPS